mmetsp:Transcript_5436/g.10688  ORF Transcript_5436/g.10688 Transcript_5436/m.10688 type:complete len:262 (-) Transcript_5436:1211-1996(-)
MLSAQGFRRFASLQKTCTYFRTRKCTRSLCVSVDAVRGRVEAEENVRLFPELYEETACKRILLSIDPDINGALSTFTWNENQDVSGLSPYNMIRTAEIQVFDMPTEIWQMRSREKRRPSPEALVSFMKQHLNVSDVQSNVVARAAVEFTTPTHLSGKFAWYDSGFASGMLYGIFHAMGIPYERVPVSSWKKDFMLTKLGKPGSMALARELFAQQSDEYLRRKKDHGRAESLLIGAWALGLRPGCSSDDWEWPDIESMIDDT